MQKYFTFWMLLLEITSESQTLLFVYVSILIWMRQHYTDESRTLCLEYYLI